MTSSLQDALQVMSSSEQPPSAGLRSTNSTSQRSPFKPYVSDSKLQAESQPLLPVSAQPVQIAYRPSAVTGFIVFAWFTSNIGLLLMNKYLLSNYGFKQPVFLTVCHMFACVVLSTAFSTTTVVPRRSIQSTQQLAKIAVLATVFVLSVVLGNISLKYIPVSFSQVCTSFPMPKLVLEWQKGFQALVSAGCLGMGHAATYILCSSSPSQEAVFWSLTRACCIGNRSHHTSLHSTVELAHAQIKGDRPDIRSTAACCDWRRDSYWG